MIKNWISVHETDDEEQVNHIICDYLQEKQTHMYFEKRIINYLEFYHFLIIGVTLNKINSIKAMELAVEIDEKLDHEGWGNYTRREKLLYLYKYWISRVCSVIKRTRVLTRRRLINYLKS